MIKIFENFRLKKYPETHEINEMVKGKDWDEIVKEFSAIRDHNLRAVNYQHKLITWIGIGFIILVSVTPIIFITQ